MPMKMCGPSSGPMKGIVAPSAASRTSRAAATAPVRRALPATPSVELAAPVGRYTAPHASARPLVRTPKRSVRGFSSRSASKPGSSKATRAPPSARVLDPDPAAVQRRRSSARSPRPRPLPPEARSRAASLRWKRSKTRSRSAGGTPGPSSSTATAQPVAAAASPRAATRPAGPAWRRALASRLRTTWASRSGSARDRARRPARRARRRRPASPRRARAGTAAGSTSPQRAAPTPSSSRASASRSSTRRSTRPSSVSATASTRRTSAALGLSARGPALRSGRGSRSAGCAARARRRRRTAAGGRRRGRGGRACG